jgi:hypothetical protein
MLDIMGTIRTRDERRLVGHRAGGPEPLIEWYAQARRRTAEVSQWRRTLEANPPMAVDAAGQASGFLRNDRRPSTRAPTPISVKPAGSGTARGSA